MYKRQAKIADIYSCFPDNTVEGRDVEQAYLQAQLQGPPTYIQLPVELWDETMKKMRCPVFKLEKALYGHKHSGVWWQEFCQEQCEKAGFRLFSPQNWPCVYWNDERKLLLVLYVDDMKLSGPKGQMEEAWKDLGRCINLEKPRGDKEGTHTCLLYTSPSPRD